MTALGAFFLGIVIGWVVTLIFRDADHDERYNALASHASMVAAHILHENGANSHEWLVEKAHELVELTQ